MNICIHMGRLVRDPEVRHTQNGKIIASFTIAVNRDYKTENGPSADFLNFKAFGKTAELLEKYFHKGSRIITTSRLQNDNYTNKEGQTVYRDSLFVESVKFVDAKGKSGSQEATPQSANNDGFMSIPDGISEEELPFG